MKADYRVEISPEAEKEFYTYLDGAADFGEETVRKLIDAYDECVSFLESTPFAGMTDLPYLLPKYRAVSIWKHFWAIYQIYDDKKLVKIDYVIDDRQNYVSFVH